MDPITGSLLIGGGASAIGGLMGNQLAQQQLAMQGQSNRFNQLSTLMNFLNKPPEIGDVNYEMYAKPTDYQIAGTYNPENLSPTELRNILINEDARQKQNQALAEYENLSQTGMTAIDQAALSEMQNQIANQERGQREAILQNMAQRGMSGSGNELAAQLQANQQASQNANLAGTQIAGQAQQARVQALQNMANLGGNLENVDYSRQANQAQAQDIINQFNVANRNTAQQQNLQNLQNVRNQNVSQTNQLNQANTDLRNQQQQQNVVNKPMAQYGLQSSYTSGVSGGLQNQANQSSQQNQAAFQTGANMLGTGMQTGGTLGSAYYMSRGK